MSSSSLRTQGPITTGCNCFCGAVVVCLLFNNSRGVWVPAFAGTTTYYGVPIPISFSAASIRSGGCILIASGWPVSSTLLRLERIAGQP